MTSRSACFFKDGDFGIDEWPTVARTEEGDIRRRSSHTRKGALPAGSKEGTSASTRGVGTSASVRSRAPAKVSEREEAIVVRPPPRLKLRPSASASALLQGTSATSKDQGSAGVGKSNNSGPENSNVPPPTIPVVTPSVTEGLAPSRVYHPPQTVVSPTQVGGRCQLLFLEDVGRFEEALSNDSLKAADCIQLWTELEMIRERERAELRACKSLVERRDGMISFFLEELNKKAERALQKLRESLPGEEDGDTTIRGPGDEEEDEEEDGEGEPEVETVGAGESVEA